VDNVVMFTLLYSLAYLRDNYIHKSRTMRRYGFKTSETGRRVELSKTGDI